MVRPTKHQYFMWMAVVAATRGTCDRLRVGCVIISNEGHVLSTGYNGSSPGSPHCDDIGHLMHEGHCVRTTHAEANAVAFAARRGTALEGSVIYTTNRPCKDCLKLLIAAGVRKVVHLEPYRDDQDDLVTTLSLKYHEQSMRYDGMLNIILDEYTAGRPWEN